MTRVSENSSYHAINHSVSKSRSRLEDLQIKGSNLRRIQKPSDDPIGNTDLLSIRSKNIDSTQYLRNINFAKAQLQFTENAIEDLSNIVSKAKEIAIGQSSNLFDNDIRKSVAREVEQLRRQALGIANKRFGNKFIFAGFKTLTRPFNDDGTYNGDANQTRLEVNKDLFVPINFSGATLFFEADVDKKLPKIEINDSPIKEFEVKKTEEAKEEGTEELEFKRAPASKPLQDQETEVVKAESRTSLFTDLERLNNALLTGNHTVVQDLLPELDKDLNRLLQARTKIGSIINTVENAEDSIERSKILRTEYQSKIEDADVAELFTNLSRQENVLNASYKASSQLINNSLLDFIK